MNVGRFVPWIVRSLLGQNGHPVHSNVCQVSEKGSALLSSVSGKASKDFRTGCKNTVHLLVKINTLQFDDYVYTYSKGVECSTQCVECVCVCVCSHSLNVPCSCH